MIFSSFSGREPWTARAGLLVTFVLAAASAGCGQRICIEWSEQEGVCPSSAETMKEHLGCTNVTSVDGEAVREGDLCCYPVTKQGPLPDCFDVTTSSGSRPPGPGPGTGTGPVCDNQGVCGTFFGGGCSLCSVNNKCGKAMSICQNSIACSNILNCASSCFEGDAQCQKKCEVPNPDGVIDFRALTTCVFCNECQNDCFSHFDECLESTTSSGFGGAGGMSGMGGAGGMSGMGGAGGKSAGP